jgi:hypothetical protein
MSSLALNLGRFHASLKPLGTLVFTLVRRSLVFTRSLKNIPVAQDDRVPARGRFY